MRALVCLLLLPHTIFNLLLGSGSEAAPPERRGVSRTDRRGEREGEGRRGGDEGG
jgi:hypothetical protein